MNKDNKPLRIGVAGCGGRMGRMVVQELKSGAHGDDVQLVGGTILDGDTPPEGIFYTTDVQELYERADALIDFTSPQTIPNHAMLATTQKKVLVVGTSGLTRDDEDILCTAAGEAQIVYAANMSLGVNLLLGLAKRAASVLGKGWDAEILDVHHKHKVDAPSGTSYALAKAVADGRGERNANLVLSREGFTGARQEG